MRKIILLGYMGCGKSTIANKLSERTAIPFLDLDQYIENQSQLSIKELFQKYGEIYFRKLEHDALVTLLEKNENLIIGLGGGTPCYANNHELLQRPDVVSIYLKASIATLFERLSRNKSNRPLIANLNDAELQEFIAKHLFDRSYYYNQAQHKVIVDDKKVDETVDTIIDVLT